MKQEWRDKYKEIAKSPGIENFQVLTGFNANIDRKIEFEDLDWSLNVDPEKKSEVSNLEDVKQVLKYAIENGENLEVDATNLNQTFEEGEKSLGGQGAIMSNFLSGLNGSVTFYTPLLSQNLADMMDDRVLHPYFDKEFSLKNIRDAANTDRTKENIIIEFKKPKSGRLILSDKLRGFGPYFRSGISENIRLIDENIEGALLAGYQNIKGNREVKIEKSKKQLQKIESRKHLELADTERSLFNIIGSEIIPLVDSIGLDETEALKLAEMAGKESSEDLGIGEAFDLLTDLMEETGLVRCHLHTYRYHLLIASEDYWADKDILLKSILFGEVSAIKSAEENKIPDIDDFGELNFDDKHIKKLDELEKFQEFFQLEKFVETGKAEIDGHKICAIPTLIHENPKRLVGMGDLISSGAFAYELSKENEQ